MKSDLHFLQNAVELDEKLYSVFERITLGNAQPKMNSQHEARVLTNETIVQAAENKTYEQLKNELREALENDAEKLKKLAEVAQAETLPHLFHKYGWRIGNPKRKEDNELAVAFCDAYRLEKIFEEHSEEQNFILLKGDLAGIQKYIYGNIQPKQAGGLRDIAKKLRGRSVIVSLLTDFLAGVMLRELGLSSWHLLFAGGGHFNLLVPKKAETVALLKVLSEDLDFQMRRRFGENLQLIVAHLEFSKAEILANPSMGFSKLITQLEKQKHQPHRKCLPDHFFSSEKMTAEETNIRRKQIEDWEIEIGWLFPKREFLVEAVTDTPIFRTEKFPEIVTFEMHKHCYSLLVPEDIEGAKSMLADSKELVSAQILLINDTDFLKYAEKFKNPKISFGFRFLGKALPLKLDEKTGREVPLTFEEIVEADGDGNKLLAALRIDVDDLGFIFCRGMSGASLGEILTLSREMQYFFSAHFDGLAEKHGLYLIYSGGDDAFAVGKWDKVIHFSRELHLDFQKFVFDQESENGDLKCDVHFSAGIFTGNPHYPVGRFYRDAGQLQDDAKNSNERKNRVKIFNQTLNWREFHSKIDLGETFAKVFEGAEKDMKKLPSAFAYRILNLVKSSFHERAHEDREGNWYNRGSINTERFARNIAGLRYFFARHGFDEKRAKESVSKIEKDLIWDFLRSFDFGDDEKIYPVRDYLVALNYAIFKNRAKANQTS